MGAVNMKNSVKIAFSGVFASLAIVIMLLAGVIPSATLSLPAVAGCVFIPIAAEISQKWAYLAFGVVAVLSFFLTADRNAFLIFTLFFGYYPILFATLSKIKNIVIAYLAKVILFSVAIIVDYLAVTFIFGIPVESIDFLGEYALPILFIMALAVFILYDFALKGMINVYFIRFRPLFTKILRR